MRENEMIPGELFVNKDAGDIIANADRATVTLLVKHTGDRPIQVGSHFHFFEVNRALDFDRATAYGMRLNVAAGTAIRFEPGDAKEVMLVALAGERLAMGHRGLVQGSLAKETIKAAAMEKVA